MLGERSLDGALAPATCRSAAIARVCGSADAYFFFQEIAGPFEPGTQYLAEAWLRADPGEAWVAPDPKSRLECFDEGSNQLLATESGETSLDGTWNDPYGPRFETSALTA